MTRSRRLLTAAALIAVTATAAATAGPAPAAKSKSSTKLATRLIGGTVWTTYTSGNVTGASQDRSTHLCRNGRFVYVSSFTAAGIIDDPSSYDHPSGESRTTGSWRVVKARISPNHRYGRIVVRYMTDAGEGGTMVFDATTRGNTVGGSPAEVGRSTVC